MNYFGENLAFLLYCLSKPLTSYSPETMEPQSLDSRCELGFLDFLGTVQQTCNIAFCCTVCVGNLISHSPGEIMRPESLDSLCEIGFLGFSRTVEAFRQRWTFMIHSQNLVCEVYRIYWYLQHFLHVEHSHDRDM